MELGQDSLSLIYLILPSMWKPRKEKSEDNFHQINILLSSLLPLSHETEQGWLILILCVNFFLLRKKKLKANCHSRRHLFFFFSMPVSLFTSPQCANWKLKQSGIFFLFSIEPVFHVHCLAKESKVLPRSYQLPGLALEVGCGKWKKSNMI